MKVGDLVKVTGHQFAGRVGLITSRFTDWEDVDRVWGVLFGAHVELMFEGALEVLSESR